MNPFGLYSPGDSPVHRLPAGAKLLLTLVVATVVVVVRDPLVLAGFVVAIALAYVLARLPWLRVWPLVRLLVVLVAFLLALQVWLVGLPQAVLTCLRLVVALSTAMLFTLTTRVDDVVATVERALGPFRRLGVRPERVAMAVGLTVAAVGTLTDIATEVREAARARGADRSITAFAAPFVIRTLQHADELGEALAARGLDDD